MQVANLFADLKTLTLCGHPEALALVNVHKFLDISATASSTGNQRAQNSSPSATPTNPDLEQANDLVNLHYSVKEHYQSTGGPDAELLQYRRDVAAVLNAISSEQS